MHFVTNGYHKDSYTKFVVGAIYGLPCDVL